MFTKFNRSICSMFVSPQRMLGRSWLTELLMRMTRSVFVGSQTKGITHLRQQLNEAQLPSPYFGKVHFSDAEVANISCLLTQPRQENSAGTVIVYLHGGGYVCGSPNSYKNISSALAYKSGCLVITPDYSLAPEHPVPAAQQDCMNVLKAVINQYSRYRIVLIGDSAGGALAVHCAQSLMVGGELAGKRKPHPLTSLVLLSPWVDPGAVGGSMESNQVNDFLNKEFIEQSYQAALQGNNQYASTVNVSDADLSMLPPTLIQCGGGEIFFDQIQTFASRLKTQGVEVVVQNFPSQFHVFQIFAPLLNDANQAINSIVQFIRSRH